MCKSSFFSQHYHGILTCAGGQLCLAHARNACCLVAALERRLLSSGFGVGLYLCVSSSCKLAQSNGWGVMVSHRSGETEDTFIADLVVGLCTGQVGICSCYDLPFGWWDNVVIKLCCTHSRWGLFWLKACRFARYMYRKLICLMGLWWGNVILCKLTFNHQLIKKKILTPVGILGFVDIEAVSKWIIFIAPKPYPVWVYRCLEPDAEIKLLIMLITLNRTELCWRLWPYFDCSFSLTFWFPFQIKTGAPCRSERLAKYNQLLRWDSRWGRRDWEWNLVQNGCSTNALGAQLSLLCLQNTLQLKTFNLTVAGGAFGLSWLSDELDGWCP